MPTDDRGSVACVGESALVYFLVGSAFYVGLSVADSWTQRTLDARVAPPMVDLEPPEAEIPVLGGIAVVTFLGVLAVIGILLGRCWPGPSRARCCALSTTVLVIAHLAAMTTFCDSSHALAIGSGCATIVVGVLLALALSLRAIFGRAV